jgi:hypothetical protein
VRRCASKGREEDARAHPEAVYALTCASTNSRCSSSERPTMCLFLKIGCLATNAMHLRCARPRAPR